MRKILFRGKRKDTGKWVYGYFYEECGDTFVIENRQTKMPYRNIPYKVDPKTVGQYTGLTDKNGTKIFEGDIVEKDFNDDISIDLIKWYVHIDCVNFNVMEKGKYTKIIGNRWDNPELLKKGA